MQIIKYGSFEILSPYYLMFRNAKQILQMRLRQKFALVEMFVKELKYSDRYFNFLKPVNDFRIEIQTI